MNNNISSSSSSSSSSSLLNNQTAHFAIKAIIFIIFAGTLFYFLYEMNSKINNILEIEKFNLGQSVKNAIMLESMSQCLKCENLINEKVAYLKNNL